MAQHLKKYKYENINLKYIIIQKNIMKFLIIIPTLLQMEALQCLNLYI